MTKPKKETEDVKMIVQSGGSKPHVVHIMKTLAEAFPNVIWKIGGKVDRTTWGGGFSAHSEGRACDIYLDAGDPLDKKLGDILFEMFYVNADYLKVDHEIWDRRIWSATKGGPRRYEGDGGPHRDHVHVAFRDDHLEIVPRAFEAMCKLAAAVYVTGHDGAADRQDGLHGPAFNPRHRNKRLTAKQRKQILLEKMGMQGA